MDDVEGFAFQMDVAVEIDGDDVMMTYAGDGLFNYSSATLTFATPNETAEKKIIVADKSYVFDASTVSWDEMAQDAPFLAFANPSVLFGVDSDELSNSEAYGQLSLMGSEVLDGVDTHVISVRLNVDRTNADGGLDVVYWVGIEDGLLRQVQAEGDFNLAGLSDIVEGIDAETGSAKLTVKIFDHGEKVDIVTPRLLSPRYGHKATLLDDGRVLVAGGFTGVANNNVIVPEAVPVVQTYDFTTATWGLVGSFDGLSEVGPGLYASTVRMADGRILGIGVIEEVDRITGSRVVLEQGGDSWTQLPPNPLARGLPEMVALDDGRVLVTGGISARGQSYEIGAVVEVYDPATGQWQQAPSMNETLEYQAVVLLGDGRVLATGGRALNFDASSRAEIYDPEANEWALTGSMHVPQSFPVAVALSDGRVLVTGVSDLNSDAPEATSEIYDPAAGTWSPTETMKNVRIFHTMTLLPDGRVLAVGGDDPVGGPNSPHSTTEIFDPRTDSWSPGPDLAEPRLDHSATLLPDGRIFLVGGIGVDALLDEIYPLDTYEFITP